MTGFDRPNRSFYLDGMNVKVGNKVRCRCNFGMYAFTVGKLYTVLHGGMLRDDNGNVTIPSCRFQYV